MIEDAEAGIDAAAGNFNSAGIGSAAKYEKCTYQLKRFNDIIDIVK